MLVLMLMARESGSAESSLTGFSEPGASVARRRGWELCDAPVGVASRRGCSPREDGGGDGDGDGRRRFDPDSDPPQLRPEPDLRTREHCRDGIRIPDQDRNARRPGDQRALPGFLAGTTTTTIGTSHNNASSVIATETSSPVATMTPRTAGRSIGSAAFRPSVRSSYPALQILFKSHVRGVRRVAVVL